MAKGSKSLTTALSVMAALLVVGGLALFWVAWRGVKMLNNEATHGATLATASSAAMTGKTDYVGTWTDGFRTLTIGADGTADYTEIHASARTEMHGTVSFDKGDLVIDSVVTKKRMHVDNPPHKAGARVLMTLDGGELEKK